MLVRRCSLSRLDCFSAASSTASSLRRAAAFFIFSPLSALLVPIIYFFSFLSKGFSVIFRLGSFILLVCLVNVRVDAAACVFF